nr:hypothetical protein Q903MT_gene2197 [Picea sitchensis]
MAHFVDVVWFFPPICGSVQGALLGRNKEAGEAAGRQPTHPIELFPETYPVLQLARLELPSSNVRKGTAHLCKLENSFFFR